MNDVLVKLADLATVPHPAARPAAGSTKKKPGEHSALWNELICIDLTECRGETSESQNPTFL
jgi:hypothetical protein